MCTMVNPHIGLPRCLGLWAETKRRSEKAMAKKRAPKRRAWNKGLEVGKRDGFTPDQVKRIRGLLANRGVPGLKVVSGGIGPKQDGTRFACESRVLDS